MKKTVTLVAGIVSMTILLAFYYLWATCSLAGNEIRIIRHSDRDQVYLIWPHLSELNVYDECVVQALLARVDADCSRMDRSDEVWCWNLCSLILQMGSEGSVALFEYLFLKGTEDIFLLIDQEIGRSPLSQEARRLILPLLQRELRHPDSGHRRRAIGIVETLLQGLESIRPLLSTLKECCTDDDEVVREEARQIVDEIERSLSSTF